MIESTPTLIHMLSRCLRKKSLKAVLKALLAGKSLLCTKFGVFNLPLTI